MARYEKFTAVIANGATESNTLDFTNPRGRMSARALHVYAPATLTGTITVEVSNNAGSTWFGLKIGGSTPGITAAFCNILDVEPAWDLMRLKSGSAEGAERTFTIVIVV